MSDEATATGRPLVNSAVPLSEEGLADRYRLLLELSPDAIVVHQAGVLVYVNSAALTFARITDRDDMLGTMITDYVHPSSAHEMIARIASMEDSAGSFTGPDDVLMVDSTGTTRPMQVTSVRTMWDRSPAYQVILRDVSAQKAAEAVVRRQATLVDHVSDAVIATTESGLIETWNPAAEQIYGVPADQAIGRDLMKVFGSNKDFAASPPKIIGVGGSVDEVHHRADTGQAFGVRVTATRLDDGYLVVAQPKRTPIVERLGSILAALHQAVILVRDNGDGGSIELANPAAGSMLDMGSRSIPGATVSSLSLEFPDDTSPITTCLRTGADFSDKTATVATSSGMRWLSCSGRAIDTDDGISVALVSLTDITDRHEHTSSLAWRASHDDLTKVLNRPGLTNEIAHQLARLDVGAQLAVYYLDLDGFKIVNDSRGHTIGDEVLRAVARRLQDAAGIRSAVGRIGGDEFVVSSVLQGTDATHVERLLDEQIEQLRAAVNTPMWLHGQEESVTASIGVAITSAADTTTAEDLLRDADIALHGAKQSTRPLIAFATTHRSGVYRRHVLARGIRSAIGSAELNVEYQPIVRCEDPAQTPVAFEALPRWDHPELGTIAAAEFFQVAEQNGVINVVDDYLFDTVLAAYRSGSFPPDSDVCINAARTQLASATYIDHIDYLLCRGIDPAHLCVEVAESIVSDPGPEILSTLSQLRERGVQVAINRFGVGASSLSQLSRLPLTAIKVGQPIIAALDTDERGRTVFAHIVTLAHALNLVVVAQGVQTRAQAQCAQDVGCDMAQGPWIAPPGPLP